VACRESRRHRPGGRPTFHCKVGPLWGGALFAPQKRLTTTGVGNVIRGADPYERWVYRRRALTAHQWFVPTRVKYFSPGYWNSTLEDLVLHCQRQDVVLASRHHSLIAAAWPVAELLRWRETQRLVRWQRSWVSERFAGRFLSETCGRGVGQRLPSKEASSFPIARGQTMVSSNLR
jgi:hypothetical protein